MIAAARIPGLAHGWEGAAWIALQRIRAGDGIAPRGFFDGLAARLEAAATGDADASPAQLIGIGGAATVAILARELEPRLAAVTRRLVARWIASTCDPARDDVLLGHPGALLALGELVEQAPSFAAPRRWIARCHRRTLAAIRRMLDGDRPHFLGLAHGLAGLLLAAECAAARLDRPRDAALIARGLERLADTRLIAPGVGTLWAPSSARELGRVPSGWCHGAAGIALALDGGHRLSGDRGYAALFAEAAPALTALRSPDRTFCCGRSGRAQILIELYRRSGERRWLTAARAVAAERASRRLGADHPDGFSQGTLGVAYVEARLARPALPLPATGFARA